MSKDENKIEKLNDENELKGVSGGFYGEDWNDEAASIYEYFGIKHNRNILRKDIYSVGETEISKESAYILRDMYATHRVDYLDYAVNLISEIKSGDISAEELENRLKTIKENF